MTEDQLAGKSRMRKKLAALSISEKIQILKKLRDRSLAFAAGGPRTKILGGDCKKVDKGSKE